MDSEMIRKLRRKLKVSRRKLAGLCGVSVRTVEGWENGRQPSRAAEKLLQNAVKLFQDNPNKTNDPINRCRPDPSGVCADGER